MNEIRLVQILNMNQNTVPSGTQPYIIGEWKTSLEDSIDSSI